MAKRITLTQEDIELIVTALRVLHDSSITNPKSYPHYALASKQRVNQIGEKLGYYNKVRA